MNPRQRLHDDVTSRIENSVLPKSLKRKLGRLDIVTFEHLARFSAGRLRESIRGFRSSECITIEKAMRRRHMCLAESNYISTLDRWEDIGISANLLEALWRRKIYDWRMLAQNFTLWELFQLAHKVGSHTWTVERMVGALRRRDLDLRVNPRYLEAETLLDLRLVLHAYGEGHRTLDQLARAHKRQLAYAVPKHFRRHHHQVLRYVLHMHLQKKRRVRP